MTEHKVKIPFPAPDGTPVDATEVEVKESTERGAMFNSMMGPC